MFAPPMPADRALELVDSAARASAADEVEVTLLGRAGEYTRFAGDRVHQPQDITELSVLVRAIVAGHAARASTSSPARVRDAVERANALARGLARAADRPGTARVGEPIPAPELQLWHDDTAAFDAAARIAMASTAMRAAGGGAAGMIGRAATQIAVATSNGVRRHAVATEATGSLTVSLDGGTSHWTDLRRASSALELPAAIERTVRRAAAGRARAELPAGRYTVVLGPLAVGDLLGFLGAFGFTGDLAAAGVGICATRPDELVASELVTVADDATADVGLPIPFDIAGTPKQVVPLLTDGVVGRPVTDTTGHAHIAREEVPAPVAANVVMRPGSGAEDDLVAGVADGLYVERFWYTRLVDRAATTITGVSRDACFRIRDGRLAEPVAGARFTQSVLDFLSTVDGVADRVVSQPLMNVWNGAVSAPAVRGTGFRFGTGVG